MKKTIITILAIISILFACKSEKEKNNKQEVTKNQQNENIVYLTKKQIDLLKLKFGSIKKRNIESFIKIDGKLQIPPQYKSIVSTQIAGKVKTINVFDGEKVKKGQTLATLEHPSFLNIQQDFYETTKQMEYLQQEYERQKELFDNKVGSGKKYQKAKTDYESIKAKYEKLKIQLSMINIPIDKVKQGTFSNTIPVKSPINGTITNINIKLGSFVSPDNTMFEIIDNSKMYAEFFVYEKDIQYVKKGQKIVFYITSIPEKELNATVFSIIKKFDNKLNAIKIYAEIKENIENFVPGMYITGYLQIKENIVPSLPQNAIVTDRGKTFIFKKINSNTKNEIALKMIEIITGAKNEKYIEVHPLEQISDTNAIVLNQAYYILAEMKKTEAKCEN